jgi:bifunctional UDP-N-acetylglucosamine pyrophosphorylase/glucosamine-1-phosphate N-acetyltransferase
VPESKVLVFMDKPLHIIVLAAGEGTRMKSRLPKVLHTVGGRPMLAYVLDTATALGPAKIHVVYNPDAPQVPSACQDYGVQWVAQPERLGTGHAVQQAMPAVPDDSWVLVLYGDTPLLRPATLESLLQAEGSLRVLTMRLDDPTGYGRILRNVAGDVTGIVEERDAQPGQLSIEEVNSGVVLARAADLRGWLDLLGADNSQGEYYLTDIFSLAAGQGERIGSATAAEPWQLLGANDRIQVAALEARHRRLTAERLMGEGVQIADPARIDLRGEIVAGSDVWLDVNVVLEGANTLGDGVSIGAGCVLRDCHLSPGTRVHPHSVLEGVRTLGACEIGPFARLRPGTELAEGSRVGNFVEVKNAQLGQGSKANHLSYLGDATIGADVNIGAGTITCNYDGANKHRTTIEDGAFIGSDTQLVAPVTVGRGANIGAGSTITRDAPPDKLTLSRSKQVTVPGWQRPKKGKAAGK